MRAQGGESTDCPYVQKSQTCSFISSIITRKKWKMYAIIISACCSHKPPFIVNSGQWAKFFLHFLRHHFLYTRGWRNLDTFGGKIKNDNFLLFLQSILDCTQGEEPRSLRVSWLAFTWVCFAPTVSTSSWFDKCSGVLEVDEKHEKWNWIFCYRNHAHAKSTVTPFWNEQNPTH